MRFLSLILILFLHLLLLQNLRFTAWPEMLAYPYLLENGFSLYKDFIMPYPPGLIFLLQTFFHIFGFNIDNLKFIAWVLVLICDFLIYLILLRSGLSKFISLFLLGVYVIWQSFLDGNMLWFDFATVAPLLLSFLFAQNWLIKKQVKWLLLLGMASGLAILVKQIAVVYLTGLLLFVFIQGRRFKDVAAVLIGTLSVSIPFLLFLTFSFSFFEFLNWGTIFPLTEWKNFPGYVAFHISRAEILVLLLLALPLSFVFTSKNTYKDKFFQLSLIFFIAAIISVYPRFSYFHLQPAIAFLVILIGSVFKNLNYNLKLKLGITLLLVSLGIFFVVGRWQFNNTVVFADNHKITESIKNYTKENERVFLLGLPSGYYIFANRLPPKNWSDNFGWYLEIPGIQDWVIKGFIETPPKVIYWKIPEHGNWYDLGVYQPKKITEYIKSNYDKKEQIEGIEIWIKK